MATPDYEIATVPGDGVGPTVIDAARPLIAAAARAEGAAVAFEPFDWGTGRYRETDAMMPDDGLDQLAGHDAILLGAVGHPDVPDHVTLRGLLLPIRKGFDQRVCRRPATLYPGVESPLRGYAAGEIDFVVFRENTEGEYADVGGREHAGHGHELAVQSAVFTREGTESIVRAAFEAATRRAGTLTNVTKSNAQAYGMVFWDDVVAEIADEYPDVTVERLLVDAAAMDLVRRPDAFDVLVASNLFGDVLTDLAAAVTGGMGLAPSANLDPAGEHPGMFEPVHGSAPDIAGEGIANPIAATLSGAMLLADVGESAAAARLRAAVRALLADPDAPRTPDIGGTATTAAVADALAARLDADVDAGMGFDR